MRWARSSRRDTVKHRLDAGLCVRPSYKETFYPEKEYKQAIKIF